MIPIQNVHFNADKSLNLKEPLDRRRMRPRKITVDLLSAAFGLGSWIAMTGLWVELPVLTHRLPEGWALASQLALYLQVANVGPIAYGLFHHWWPSWATETAANHLQLAVGAVATFLLIFMWSWTVKGMSVPFFFLSFCLSLVDCTSSVTFLPFMANFRPVYLTPYLLGEGLSGLIPSLVATAQGVESPECVNRTSFSEDLGRNVTEVVPYIREPRFEPEWFFAILLMMELLSWLAFVLLDKLPLCQSEKVKNTSKKDCFEMQCMGNNQEEKKTNRSTSLYLYLLFLQGWASIATFGIFPAIQPYSSLPYGDTAFHLVVILCGVAYPVSCFAAIFLEVRSICAISWMTVFATVVSLYAAATAVLSPRPPLAHTEMGSALIVVCWVTFMFTFSYIKTMATILLGDYWGHRALFWCGAVTQGGALAGALVMFLLINVFHFFQDEEACLG